MLLPVCKGKTLPKPGVCSPEQGDRNH
jgi:hypothetical protein